MFRKQFQHCTPHISPFLLLLIQSIDLFCWDVLQWAPPRRYFQIEMTSLEHVITILQERVVLSIEPIQLDYLCIQGNKASHQSRYFPPFQLCAIRKLFHQHEVAWTFYFNSFIIMNCCYALLHCCRFTNNGISLVCMWELTLLNIGKQLTIQ